MLLMVI